jgi:hypothetical protein
MKLYKCISTHVNTVVAYVTVHLPKTRYGPHQRRNSGSSLLLSLMATTKVSNRMIYAPYTH